MDQQKIGKFIAQRRKAQGLTQIQWAEQLNITDRAVSKWETGKAMPDTSIMLELCDLLQISVNDILNGEIVSPESYSPKLEQRLLDVLAQKEATTKRLMRQTLLSLVLIFLLYAVCLVTAYLTPIEYLWISDILFLLALLCTALGTYISVSSRTIGFFQCSACSHTYTPTAWATFFAWGGFNTIRIKCPHCQKRTRHHRVYQQKP